MESPDSDSESDGKVEVPDTPKNDVLSLPDTPTAVLDHLPVQTQENETEGDETEDEEDDESENEDEEPTSDEEEENTEEIVTGDTDSPMAKAVIVPDSPIDVIDDLPVHKVNIDEEKEDEEDESEDEEDESEIEQEEPTGDEEEELVPDTLTAKTVPNTHAIAVIDSLQVPNEQDDNEDNDEGEESEEDEDSVETSDDDCFPDDNLETDDYIETPELIHLPFMKKKFIWSDLMPNSFYNRTHTRRPIEVSSDLVQSGKSVSVSDMRRRCRYKNKDHYNKVELKIANDFIVDLVKKIKINIQVIVCKFFMTIATYMKFGINEASGTVETYDDFVEAVEGVDNEEDGKKVAIICYLVFDFMLHWQIQVSEIVCKRLNIKVVDKEKKKKRS
jgi:hypothetical protein